jgi:phage-related protein
VREWLKGLAREERHIIGEDLLTVQHAWPVGKPLVDHLGDGVWELRSRLPTRVARTLFMLDEGAIVVLHGFIKKTRKTPARERQRQYEEPYD